MSVEGSLQFVSELSLSPHILLILLAGEYSAEPANCLHASTCVC